MQSFADIKKGPKSAKTVPELWKPYCRNMTISKSAQQKIQDAFND